MERSANGASLGALKFKLTAVADRKRPPDAAVRPPAQLWAPEGGEDGLQFCDSGVTAK
ncbi:Hypothetical predicted protein, partial [Marmota monax]